MEENCHKDPDYYEKHKCCPKCGNSSLETTTHGCIVYVHDRNSARCSCGWRGIVHDLVKEEI